MIVRSPYPDVDIPDLPLTAYVLRHAQRLAATSAIVDASTGRAVSYATLATDVQAVAAGLTERGFRQGDVFGIYAPNCPEYTVAMLAVASLGGITTTVNHLATADELSRQLKDAGATLLLTHETVIDRAIEGGSAARIRELFVVGHAGTATRFDVLKRPVGAVPSVTPAPDQVVFLPYSSGTTGLPKGVEITHRAWVANLAMGNVPQPVTEGDVVVCLPPLFHIYGAYVSTLVLAGGGTLVISAKFDLACLLRSIARERVTRAYLVPPVVLALVDDPTVDAYDLSSLECINCAAAPLGVEIARRCQDRIGCSVIQGYGLTETVAPTHLVPVTGRAPKPGSVGPCLPNTECKVVEIESGMELPAGELGELLVRGPQLMRGYLHRPEATAATITADGWLRTGDVGYADADGDFYIVDRLKELIKYKAYQVAPAELEAVLLAHPAVADAAVIPSADAEAGEVPKAFIVLRAAATAEELMAFVAGRVAPYKKVRRVEFVEQIPKSPSGKILRRVLVERDRANALSLA